MSAQKLMCGQYSKNCLFLAMVMVSLSLHLAALWWVRDSSSVRSKTHNTLTSHPIEVSLSFSRAAPQSTVKKHDDRRVAPAIRHHAKPVVPAAREQQVPTSSDSEEHVVNDVSEEVASGASETIAADNRVQDLAAREHYLAAVLARIESFKFYPLMARRHGLQGRVEVRFKLDAQGMVSGLDITGSHSLFIEAARAAVRSATPLPAAASLDGFPLEVHFQMIFSLH